MKLTRILSSLIVTTLLISGNAWSATTLSNLSQTDSGNGFQFSGSTWRAIPFITDSQTYQVSSVTAAMFANQPNPSLDPDYTGLHFEIFENSVLPSIGPSSSIGRLEHDLGLSSLQEQHFTGTITLQPDTTYWLAAAVDNGGPNLGFTWDLSDSKGSDPGSIWTLGNDLIGNGTPTEDKDYSYNVQVGTWNSIDSVDRGYFSIDATVVPEPSGLLLTMLGALSLLMVRKRERIG